MLLHRSMRRARLAGGRNIVQLAFDSHQRGLCDRPGLDQVAVDLHQTARQQMALEHALDRLEIEFGGQVDTAIYSS